MRGYRGRYFKKKFESPLPELTDNERIYLKVSYTDRYFARTCHCGFDREKKLWFTGAYNGWLDALIELYGVDEENTSDDAKELMQMALDTPDRDELLTKLLDWYEARGVSVERPAPVEKPEEVVAKLWEGVESE